MKPELEPVIAKSRAERRRFRRVRVDLPGRLFVPSQAQESVCKVIDLSPGGAAIQSEMQPETGVQVVLYVDGFGRFEGVVATGSDGGFGVRFNCTPMKRERIAEQLTLFLNRDVVTEADLRRHDRTPAKGFTRFTRSDGEMVKCEVLDLSLSGVSVKTDSRPPVGEFVLIGQMAGRVARHHDEGVGIEFVGSALPDKTKPEQLKAKLVAVR